MNAPLFDRMPLGTVVRAGHGNEIWVKTEGDSTSGYAWARVTLVPALVAWDEQPDPIGVVAMAAVPAPEPDQPTTAVEYAAYAVLAVLLFLGLCGVERWLG